MDAVRSVAPAHTAVAGYRKPVVAKRVPEIGGKKADVIGGADWAVERKPGCAAIECAFVTAVLRCAVAHRPAKLAVEEEYTVDRIDGRVWDIALEPGQAVVGSLPNWAASVPLAVLAADKDVVRRSGGDAVKFEIGRIRALFYPLP